MTMTPSDWLSPRERFALTLQHRPTDRPPRDLMGNATMLLDGTYLRLRDYLGLSPIPPVRSGSTANYYDERILEILGVDFRRLFLKRPAGFQKVTFPDGDFLDEFGVRCRPSGIYINFVEHPLAGIASQSEAEAIARIEAFPWPEPQALYTAEGLAEQARQQYENSPYVLVARNPFSLGFLDRSCALAGIAEFMMLLAQSPKAAQALIAHLLEIFRGVYGLFLEAVGPYVQMIEYGDDLGGQSHPLISPRTYAQLIQPAEAALFRTMKEKAPQAAIFHHSDGAIFPLIPGMIEAGMEILNPVQTSAKGMEAERLKATFGAQLVFHGGIERVDGSLEELRAELQHKLATLGAGGGYILAPCNHMIDVPPENILAMYTG